MNVQELKSSEFLGHLTLRFLNNDDIEDLKKLCLEWFPLRYPDSWYKQVTNNPSYYSLAAIYNNQTIGVLIAEIRDRGKCNQEDRDMLGYWYPFGTKMAYILIVGTAKEYRRKGIASFLLQTFLSGVNTVDNANCKVVYLHVLTSNVNAVLFYERQDFRRHKLLPLYYTINGCKMDGYTYVYYVNDGAPPFTFKDFLTQSTNYLARFRLCKFTRYVVMRLWSIPSILRVNQQTRSNRMVCHL